MGEKQNGVMRYVITWDCIQLELQLRTRLRYVMCELNETERSNC